MKKFFYLNIVVLTASLLFSSCHKGSTVDDTDASHVIRNNNFEVVSNDIFKMFLYNIMAAEDSIYTPNDSLNFRYFEPCLQLSISPYDTVTWPKTITVAFPESGCLCYDGNIRSGQIIITANGLYKETGSQFNLTLSNYSVNGITVGGYKKLSVVQSEFNGSLALNDSSVLQNVLLPESSSWHAEHFLQWVLGFDTKSNIADDLFIYTGTSSMLDYSGFITDALQFRNYCFWIGHGSIEITPSDLSKRQIIYTDSCLNQADVIINNETYRVSF
jgi:hypothetical protein